MRREALDRQKDTVYKVPVQAGRDQPEVSAKMLVDLHVFARPHRAIAAGAVHHFPVKALAGHRVCRADGQNAAEGKLSADDTPSDGAFAADARGHKRPVPEGPV